MLQLKKKFFFKILAVITAASGLRQHCCLGMRGITVHMCPYCSCIFYVHSAQLEKLHSRVQRFCLSYSISQILTYVSRMSRLTTRNMSLKKCCSKLSAIQMSGHSNVGSQDDVTHPRARVLLSCTCDSTNIHM
jgi:hypothetical protein